MEDGNSGLDMYGPQAMGGAESQSFDGAAVLLEVPNVDRSQPIHVMDDSQLVGVPVPVAGDSSVVGGETAVSTVDAGANLAEVKVLETGAVKRKRGRPPRGQAKPPPAKKNKEEEDVCFICFDGGSLVLCDRRGCPKAYHPACIKRDEEFFRSKARWNCGWHICSICQKAAHHMCYTCTYSLCKVCIKDADYVCVRGDKGFCTICMRTIMLIENSVQGKEEMAQVDFDDKSSWEYLFKVYWLYLKGKLSLTLNELAQAKNPWKGAGTMAREGLSPSVHNGANDLKSFTSDMSSGNLEANNSKRRKTDEELKLVDEDSLSTEKPGSDKGTLLVGCKEWATKELLEFVSYMRNGDTSALSQFDVQALMLEYIKRNNLRDPRRKSQIICDSRLKNLFGKPRVGHFEMLKLLEFHFLIKEDSQKTIVDSVANQGEANLNTDNILVVGRDMRRKTRRKGEERAPQTNLDEYAAIDVHNINLIYLRRNLMESLIEDSEKFHGKVVGSIVRIRISGSDQKQDMYRLVQVVGTSKVDVPYKLGNKSVDVMLEVLNLDKKETVSIDTISHQELSEDECRRLRQSIRCGLVKQFTVGEIQEKAVALQSLRLNDWLEMEILRLNHLRDRASEKGHKKELRECVEKLQLLKTPEERQRRLREIPEIHAYPKINPDYESEEDAGEFNKKKQGEYMKPRYSGFSGKGGKSSSPQKRAVSSTDSGSRAWKNFSTCEQTRNMSITYHPDKEEGSTKTLGRVNMGQDALGSSSLGRQQNEVDCNGSAIGNSPSANDGETDKLWHYRDPNGRVQGPFSMIQLQKWSTTGYFPPDMRIWASRQDDSLLLADALKGQFHNSDVKWSENINATEIVSNQIDRPSVRSPLPSSTLPGTLERWNSDPNFGNHENKSNSHGFLDQSFGQNWRALPVDFCSNNLNSNPSVDSVVDIPNLHSPTPKASGGDWEGQVAENKQPVSSVLPVRDSDLLDLPSPTPKTSNQDEKVQDAGEKQSVPSKILVQDSGPSWSSASSLVVGGAQLPEIADEWGGYSPTLIKPSVEEWDSGLVSVSSLKPLEAVGGDHVATPTSNIDQIIHSSPSQPTSNVSCLEPIEFSTLAEESVSDLLAEVDAMESQNGLASPTSRRNCDVDFIHVSIEEFSPSPDQGTRSDGFSSSGDIQLPCQSTTTDELVGASQAVIFDFLKMSSLDGETKNANAFSHGDMVDTDNAQRPTSQNTVAKWAEVERETRSTIITGNEHGSDHHVDNAGRAGDGTLQQSSARAEAERETKSSDVQVEKEEDGKYPQRVAPLTTSPDLVNPSIAQTAGSDVMDLVWNSTTIDHGREGGGTIQQSSSRDEAGGEAKPSDVPVEQEEEGENIQPPAPMAMGPDLVDPKIVQRAGSEVMDSVWNSSTINHGRAGDGMVEQSSTRNEVEGGTKSSDVPAEQGEEGEYIQPQAPLAMGSDLVDPKIIRRAGSEFMDSVWDSTTDHGRASDGMVQQSSSRAEVEGETKSTNVPVEPEEEGEYVQPAVPLIISPDLVDPRRAGSEVADSGWGTMQQGNVNLNWGRSSVQGITNTGRGNANTNHSSFAGSVGWDNQRRGGERFNSPRDRAYQGGDSGFSRVSRSSGSRQPFGGAGGGGGYSRPPPKGQRVCKFYESGRCKKGASCNYLHP